MFGLVELFLSFEFVDVEVRYGVLFRFAELALVQLNLKIGKLGGFGYC